MTTLYILIGAVVFWACAVVASLILALVLLVLMLWAAISCKEWLRQSAIKRADAYIAKHTLKPPVHPSEAETAKMPTITEPSKDP